MLPSVASYPGFFSGKSSRLTLLLLAVLLVHACGFNLRGSLKLSGEISPVYVQQNSAFELVRDIKSLLKTNNIVLADKAMNAQSQLSILKEEKSSRVLSVDGNGQVSEYLLIYKVFFSIKIKQQEESHDSISVSRGLVFDSGAVLGFANESEISYKDMRRDVARLILLKLQAHSRTLADSNKSVTDETFTDKNPAKQTDNIQQQ